jgi:hypothetical protein
MALQELRKNDRDLKFPEHVYAHIQSFMNPR